MQIPERKTTWSLVSLLAAVFVCALLAPQTSKAQAGKDAPASSTSVEARQSQLAALFNEQWEYVLRTSPEWATVLGDKRYNNRLSDISPAFFQADLAETKKFLARFEAIESAGLSHQDALSRELMIRQLREQVEGAPFKDWEMPVNQMNGPHLELPDLVALTPFNTVTDYENYLARLRQIPSFFEQLRADMRQGVKDGLMPPRYLLEKVAAESADVASKTGPSSPFAKPLGEFPASIPAQEQARLKTAILAAITDGIIPAYERFTTFVREEYAPHGRTEPGVWALPDGEARYRFAIREITTTNLAPQEIHEIGLQQVHDTEAEMLEVARKLGYPDLAALHEHIKSDKELHATSGQQLLDLYSGYAASMQADLPKLFGRLPKSKLVAIPMEPSRSPNAVPADYNTGTPDGSRPGHINVNEWNPTGRLLLNVEAIAYHEGIPGHHMQLSLAQELTNLPSFRQHAGYTAFVEGWALYSERLAKEVGHYKDPYSDYGRLENEMWRAIRLVVDTGVHQKHWSRDQMIEYFHRYTAMDEPNVQSEVDRYICWPAQALAYKLGQLEILKLREAAQRQLGDKFAIRTFHDELLTNGALPLDVLDSEVTAWIAAQSKH